MTTETISFHGACKIISITGGQVSWQTAPRTCSLCRGSMGKSHYRPKCALNNVKPFLSKKGLALLANSPEKFTEAIKLVDCTNNDGADWNHLVQEFGARSREGMDPFRTFTHLVALDWQESFAPSSYWLIPLGLAK